MIVLPDASHDPGDEFKPLAPFASASDVLKAALPALVPINRIGVVDAACKYMKVNAGGRWVDFDKGVTPYAIEPANMISSRMYRELIFAGPARAGKTVILQQGASHAITCDPGVVHIFHMTDRTATQWVDEELEPMIMNSPELLRRLGKGRSDNNKLSKKFLGGTKLTIGPPVIGDLSGRTVKLVMFTDLDRMPLSIGKEGSPFKLGSARTTTLRSRGMTAGESSPGHPITDPGWKNSTPHEAPPCDGILELYNGGTKARWYWECFDCEAAFEPRFDRLHYDKDLTPAQAGACAEMQCPHCGSLMSHKHKVEANSKGYWLHESEVGELVRIETGSALKTDRLSYWLNGAAAAFSTWERLVTSFEVARRSVDAGGDEEILKVTVNTDQGAPYLPRALMTESQLSVNFLKEKQSELDKGIAPAWARFITIGVDVQKGRFVVQVLAWGASGERAIIDRFDIHQPPEGAPLAADRILEPETYIEDWEALRPLLSKVYPLDGRSYGLTALAIGCDFHGAAGVSDNAELFWRKRKKDGEIDRWYMIRGHGGFKVPGRVWYKAPERGNAGKKARSIKLLNIATDKLKDSVMASLNREGGGPGATHVGAFLTDAHLTEFTAEARSGTGWKMRPGMVRNEAIDVSAYGLAVALHKGMDRIDYSAPPSWARLDVGNDNAVALDLAPEIVPAQVEKVPRKKRASRKIKYLET